MLLRPRQLLLLCALAPALSFAQRDSTREALTRLEETLSLRVQDDGLQLKDLAPAIVVDAHPAFEETKTWFPTAALASLARIFGAGSLRSCEACMAPRLYAQGGRLEHSTGGLSVTEVVRLDENSRGQAAPAKTAIWLDETVEGVSLRIVDLRNSRLVLAQNFDPQSTEDARSRLNLMAARELDRRRRGDSLTHTFFDVGVFPAQHVSFDWLEQWGDTNANLSGFTVSAFDPLLGLGGGYFRVIPQAFNVMVGAKLLMSLPSVLVSAVSGQVTTIIDPPITGVLMIRVPIGRSNYGVIASLSTNGRFTVGISLLNLSLLPFLP